MAALQTKLPQITLLTDSKLGGLTAWGVLVPGEEHPIPATFVVDKSGVVRWRYIYQPRGDWPTLAEVTAALEKS